MQWLPQDVAEASRKAGGEAGNGAADGGIPDTVVRHLPLHAVALDADSFVLAAAGSAAVRARTGAFPAGYHTPAGAAAAGMFPFWLSLHGSHMIACSCQHASKHCCAGIRLLMPGYWGQ